MKKEKLHIVKIGGNVINDPQKLKKFLSDFSAITDLKILVHGGGKILEELALKMGIEQTMVNGRRITGEDTIKLATMVYAGLLNKQIVALLQANSTNAIGLSGADANSISATKRIHAEYDFGFVGDLKSDSINSSFISLLLKNGLTPVFCAITHDNQGQLFNTNADTLASELAMALSKNYDVDLNYCFDKKGVLKDMNDENSLIENITRSEYKILLEQGIVSKGMIPKLDTAFKAIDRGVTTVVIAHSDELSNTIARKSNAGTYLVA